MKKIIGLDLDEVCCDLVSQLCGYIGDVYDAHHNDTVFSSYNFYDNKYTRDHEVNKSIADDLVVQVNDVSFLREAKPIPGTPEVVKALKSMGHEVHILTARARGEEAHTQLWLKDHGFDVDSITHIGYLSSKGVVGKEMGLDIFVDDHTYNVDDMVKHTDADVYLVSRPWNIDYFNAGVKRINHLEDLLSVINIKENKNVRR